MRPPIVSRPAAVKTAACGAVLATDMRKARIVNRIESVEKRRSPMPSIQRHQQRRRTGHGGGEGQRTVNEAVAAAHEAGDAAGCSLRWTSKARPVMPLAVTVVKLKLILDMKCCV